MTAEGPMTGDPTRVTIDDAQARLLAMRPRASATARYVELWTLAAELLNAYAYTSGKVEGFEAFVASEVTAATALTEPS
jgi:hypothetical protein